MNDEMPIGKGTVIDKKYMVLDRLGAGGFGAVYRCCQTSDGPNGPQVGIKILDGLADVRRFRREADIIWSANHPNVVRCLDYGMWESRYYLVMELANGGNLEDLLDKRRQLSVQDTAWVAYQVAAGLGAVGLPHRDIKPGNILLANPPGMKQVSLIVGDITAATRVLVADWGLARKDNPGGERLTKTNVGMGSPHYMAPEQCRDAKSVTVRADIYALGAVMFQMLTGSPPFQGEDATEIIIKHISDPVVYPDGMAAPIRSILERCLEKDEKRRFPDMLHLRLALQPLLGQAKDWHYMGASDAESPKPAGWTAWIRRLIPNTGEPQ